MQSKSLRIVLALVVCGLAGSASAQQAPVTSFNSMMNSIIRSTPGITNVSIGTGVRVAAAGTVPVATTGGLTIPVATTVAADVGAGTMAAALGRVAVRAVPWVGAAVLAAEVGKAIVENSNIRNNCQISTNIFCTTGEGSSSTTYKVGVMHYNVRHPDGGSSGDQTSVAAACSAFTSSRTAIHASSDGYSYSCVGAAEWIPGQQDPSMTYKWVDKKGQPVSSYTSSVTDMGTYNVCPDGKTKEYTRDGMCPITSYTPGPEKPATEEDINEVLTRKANADHDWLLRMKAQMDQMSQQNTDLEPPINWKGVPITVNAPPAAGPETQVSTRQVPNADGTTSTETVKTQTTVTPTAAPGGTVDNPGVTFPSKTTTTTTTINNTTNVKNETTNVTNNAAVPEKTELPTDYAREPTLKAILGNLTTEYTGEKPKGDQELKDIDSQNKTNAAVVDGISEGSTGLKGWLPTIKTATCRNPKVPQPLTGALVDVPICDTVDVFASLISAVIAVAALYGSVREVQAAIKA